MCIYKKRKTLLLTIVPGPQINEKVANHCVSVSGCQKFFTITSNRKALDVYFIRQQ